MRLACWQVAALPDDATRRITRLAQAAGRARHAGADLLVTPELSLTGYRLRPGEVRQDADHAGELAARVARIAAEHRIAIVYGVPELDGERIYNTVRLIDEHGAPVAAYRKAHLYGPAERDVFAEGDTGVVQAQIGGITVGLLICYDVEFPEAVRAHTRAGTELLAVPSALVDPWSFVAEVLVPARAFESQLYVAYTNWSGPAGPTGASGYCGLTRVVDPLGRITTATGTGEDLVLADIERTEIVTARRTTPYLADLRPHLYPAGAGGQATVTGDQEPRT